MSTRAVEELIMKAMGDVEFRQRLESTPEAVCSEFDLTVEEQAAVMQVQNRLSKESEPVGAMLDIVPMGSW